MEEDLLFVYVFHGIYTLLEYLCLYCSSLCGIQIKTLGDKSIHTDCLLCYRKFTLTHCVVFRNSYMRVPFYCVRERHIYISVVSLFINVYV